MTFADAVDMKNLLVPAVMICAGIGAGYICEKILLVRLLRWTRRTPWEGDEIVVSSFKGFVLLLFSLVGLFAALKYHPATSVYAHTLDKISTVLFIFLGTLVLVRMSSRLVQMYSQRVTSGFMATSIFGNLTGALVFVMGALMILQYLNISIAPILTALGVGGLAVALALQDTLANLFAGIHIIASKQIKQGDYIRLASGVEGFVTDITWRYSNIRALSNNITIIPNAELAKAVVINFDLQEQEMSVLVPVGVSYDSDLEKVERVTLEVAREVMQEVEGGVPGFDPLIRFHTFNDSSIDFNVIMRSRQFVDQNPIRHEFIKRLHRRYLREGIEIPFPIRTVHIQRTKASGKGIHPHERPLWAPSENL